MKPGRDTLVMVDTLRLSYLIDGQPPERDTLCTLHTGLNRLVVDTVGKWDLRGADTLYVIHCPGPAAIHAQAESFDTVFSYQYLILDGRSSSGPEGVPLRYSWRQLYSDPYDYVAVPDSTWPVSRVMARDAMTLHFELGVSDTL
ncbi:MAG: hypothetical protein GF331_23705, partial [Chitinivibrionales bacterium]|nr:hypothetical protein [Chitinivibrionales bacterium]